MRVLVTGATGFIGSAIVRELLDAGHEVLGLARNDHAADTLAQFGVTAHRGDLSDLDSLAAGARVCDGVIHTAFGHDFSKYQEAGETDRHAVEAMANALVGTSAGGGLVLATVQRAKADGLPLPGAIAPLSPWSDLTETGDSYQANEWIDNVLVSYKGYLGRAALLYAHGRNLCDQNCRLSTATSSVSRRRS
jgi:NAD(P)-dependent dehydrogenase (short-subunit alcohol dehydrogenase family)